MEMENNDSGTINYPKYLYITYHPLIIRRKLSTKQHALWNITSTLNPLKIYWFHNFNHKFLFLWFVRFEDLTIYFKRTINFIYTVIQPLYRGCCLVELGSFVPFRAIMLYRFTYFPLKNINFFRKTYADANINFMLAKHFLQASKVSHISRTSVSLVRVPAPSLHPSHNLIQFF